jgi:co-chaperonin GroES (HSP10)
MQALGDWVILEPLASNADPSTEGGIHIPEAARESIIPNSEEAICVSAGEECTGELKKGDRILVMRGTCFTMPVIAGNAYLCCKYNKVVAVL